MLLTGTMLLAVVQTKAQTKIGAAGAPDGSAMLEVTSGTGNNKGLLPPRMTTVQRNAIASPATGLMIYNTTANQMQVNTGTPAAPIWTVATVTTTGWNTTGNAGTAPATNFIGTTDNQPLAIRTNNTEKVSITSDGNVGIGIATPVVKLQVRDTGDVTMLIGTPNGNRGHIALGNGNHGLIRNLTSSGGEANDIALYTTAGNAVGAALYLVSDPTTSNDSLPLDQFVLRESGNIGIGIKDPASRLHLNDGSLMITNDGPIATSAISIIADNAGPVNPDNINITTYGFANPLLGISAARGTAAAPLNSQSGDNIGGISFGARANGTFAIASGINATYSGDSTNLNSSLSFTTSGATQMVIDDNGDVGIGITNPHSRLDLGTTIGSSITDPAGKKLALTNNAAGNNFYGLGISGGTLQFHAGSGANGAPLMVLVSNGSVGIGVNTPAYKLDVAGDINASANVRAGGVVLTSDARLKRNITNSSYGLSTIMDLRPVVYDKKNSIPETNYDRHEIGFIAQEMAKVLPSLVTEGKDADKTLAVSYTELIPVLTKAVQEQQAEIETLKAENKALKETKVVTAQLMERVKQMEQMMGIKEMEGTSKVAGK